MWRPRAIGLAVALTLASSAASVKAAPGDAPSHFKHGVALYDEGDFAAALVEFRRAYELRPDFHVLYNIGQASFVLKDYASALAAFRKYLDDGGRKVPAARKTQVDKDIAELEGRVARVRITVDVDGLDVLVDGKVAGKSPLAAPVIVNIGTHDVRVEGPDGNNASRSVDVASGDDKAVTLTVRQPKPAAPPPPPTPTPTPAVVPAPVPRTAPSSESPPVRDTAPARSGSSGLIGGVLIGAGGIVLGGGVALDLFGAGRQLDRFETLRAADDPAAADAQKSARTYQTLSLVAYGVGAAAVLGGVAVLLFAKKGSPSVKAAGTRVLVEGQF